MCANLMDMFKKKPAPVIPAQAPASAKKADAKVKTGEATDTGTSLNTDQLIVGTRTKRKGVPGLAI